MAMVEEGSKTAGRVVYTYDIPAEVQEEHPYLKAPVTSIGLIALTLDEELAAAGRGNGQQTRVGVEEIKAAVVEVNGKALSYVDGAAEAIFNQMPPRIRSLIALAFQELHAAPAEAAPGFLKSRKARAG